MAKTIGKDKGSVTRTRASRVSVDAEAEPVGALPSDEPRDEDTVAAEQDDEPGTVSNEEEEAPRTDDTLGSTSVGAIARRRETSVARGMVVPKALTGNPLTRFIAESYIELRKVTWPTMNEAWTMTLVVIAMSAVVAVILGLTDLGLIKLLQWIVGPR